MPGHRTKGFCASATALLLCAVLAGCGGSGESADGGKAVLRYTWWGNPDRAERTERAVALFEKQHPDIDVQTSFSGYDAYKQKLATQAAGGDAPDVMQLDYRQIDQYASGGVLLDLAEQKSVLRTGEIDQGLLATGQVDGGQYAIPQGRGTETVAYDVQAWKASGVPLPGESWTWTEWADTMRELAERTGKPGATDPGQSEDSFEVWLRGQGKSLYTEDGGLGFTADDLTRWWTFTDGLRRAGVVSPAEQTTQLDGSVENTPLGRGTAFSDTNRDAPASGYLALLPGGVALAPMTTGEDGTPGHRSFFRVILPLTRPALITTAIFTFISTWNDFFTQLIYLFDPDKFTLTLALRSFVDASSTSSFGPMFAMSVIALLPIVLFFLAFQRFLVEGMAGSGLKG